jgi:hypothetical protein
MAEKTLLAAVARQDLAALKKALARERVPVPARAIVQAAGLGWKAGLALLAKAGGDLDGSYRNYRALHALIQAEQAGGDRARPDRAGRTPADLANVAAVRAVIRSVVRA